MAQYDLVAVERTPQVSGAPTLTELGPLHATVEYTDSLNEAPEGNFQVNVNSLTSGIKAALRDPVGNPLEVWVYRDGTKVFAGPVIGGEIQSDILTLTCRGLEFYTAYMLVETDKAWSAVDQYTIATDVIDDWQGQSYGNYGIDTTAIGTSGTTRSLAIPGGEEPRIVYEVLRDLSGLDNGFDWWVDPTDGDLELAASRGSDLSASVFLELGVRSAAVRFSVAPGAIASEVHATGMGGDPIITTSVENTTLRNSWGKAGVAVSVDDDPDSSTLTDVAQAVLDARDDVFFVPGPELIPVTGADVDDFGVGDTVTYTYDAGLGQQTGAFRILKRTVSVDANGQEIMAVTFA